MHLLIVRHCETKKNIDNKFDMASANDELTVEGQKQLSDLCKYIQKNFVKIPVIYSSPRKRSELTAKGISEYFQTNYTVAQSLPPISPGKLSGLTEKQAFEQYPLLMEMRLNFRDGLIDGYKINFPGGDSIKKYEKNISEGIQLLISKNNVFILITHRSVMLAVLNIFYKKFKKYSKDRYHFFETPKGLMIEITTYHPTSSLGNIKIIGNHESWKNEC